MAYFCSIDNDGFLTVSTLDTSSNGNSTKEEHDTVSEMYRNAERGYGVVRTSNGYEYAIRPTSDTDDNATEADYIEALNDVGVDMGMV